MNAVCLYVSTARFVLQNELVSNTSSNSTKLTSSTSIHLSDQKLNDLNQLLTNLRLSLSCAVCCHLLNDPYAPRNGHCQHNVCRLCMHEPKSLRPLCNICKDCQDFKSYDENRQLRCLLLCYKSLCEYLNNSSVFAQLSKQKVSQPQMVLNSTRPNVPLPNMSPQDFILEGCKYEDISNIFNADLPRPSCLPRLLFPNSTITPTQGPLSTTAITPLSSISTSQNFNVQITQKAAVPANSIASNSATLPITPSTSAKSSTTTTQTATSNASQQSPAIAPKQIKSVVDVSALVPIQKQAVTVTTTGANSNISSVMSLSPTITYMGSHTPGIVVPIVSSSATTTAPLTIASARLQSLNRQLTQSRNVINVPANLLAAKTNDSIHPSVSFKMSLAQPTSTTATATATSTVTSQEARNPPPIKTVSNGSAMYSVLYTGIGNKITIKRKIDGYEDTVQKKDAPSSVPVPIVFRPFTKINSKRRGCRCGNATPTPGKLTCCGQRCPCYVDSKSCIGCKCRGCRNPHRPDGGKVRPVIPELACYDIQVADENSIESSSEISQPARKITQTSPIAIDNLNSHSQPNEKHTCQVLEDYTTKKSIALPQVNVTPTPPTKLISFSSFQRMAAATQQKFQTITAFNGSGQQTSTVATVNALDSQPRDAMLIQNTNGKYQVVNVLTAASLQRLHSIASNLQTSNTTSNTPTSLPSATNTYILPNSSVTQTTTTATGNVTAAATTNLPQIIIQPQNHQQHAQTLQRININNIASTAGGVVSTASNSMPTLPNSNIITLHPISSSHAPTTQQTIQLVSTTSASPTATITFSPIIVASPNNLMPETVSNYVNLKESTSGTPIACSMSSSSSHLLTIPTLPND